MIRDLLDTVNEGTSATLTIDFFDENDDPVQPTSLSYIIHDVLTGNLLLGTQTATPSGSSHTIIIDPSINNIVNEAREIEYRRLTATFTITATRVSTKEYCWAVKNLHAY